MLVDGIERITTINLPNLVTLNYLKVIHFRQMIIIDHSNTTPVLKQLKGYGKYGLNSIRG